MTEGRLIRAGTRCAGGRPPLTKGKTRARGAAGPAERREQLTPNRSAGRIESELWDAFLAKCKADGLSNTDGMREMIRSWTGMTEPAPPVGDAGSAAEALSVS
jgi:hypothetical protein